MCVQLLTLVPHRTRRCRSSVGSVACLQIITSMHHIIMPCRLSGQILPSRLSSSYCIGDVMHDSRRPTLSTSYGNCLCCSSGQVSKYLAEQSSAAERQMCSSSQASMEFAQASPSNPCCNAATAAVAASSLSSQIDKSCRTPYQMYKSSATDVC